MKYTVIGNKQAFCKTGNIVIVFFTPYISNLVVFFTFNYVFFLFLTGHTTQVETQRQSILPLHLLQRRQKLTFETPILPTHINKAELLLRCFTQLCFCYFFFVVLGLNHDKCKDH